MNLASIFISQQSEELKRIISFPASLAEKAIKAIRKKR
jgi:hypothetical protein